MQLWLLGLPGKGEAWREADRSLDLCPQPGGRGGRGASAWRSWSSARCWCWGWTVWKVHLTQAGGKATTGKVTSPVPGASTLCDCPPGTSRWTLLESEQTPLLAPVSPIISVDLSWGLLSKQDNAPVENPSHVSPGVTGWSPTLFLSGLVAPLSSPLQPTQVCTLDRLQLKFPVCQALDRQIFYKTSQQLHKTERVLPSIIYVLREAVRPRKLNSLSKLKRCLPVC